VRKFFKTAFIISFLMGLVLGSLIYWALFLPNTSNQEAVIVYIPSNSDFETVVHNLEPYLKNQQTFDWVAQLKKYPQTIKPGKYEIPANTTNWDLVNLLRSGRQQAVKVTFNNLKSLPQFCGVVAKQLEFDSIACWEAFTNPEFLQSQQLDLKTAKALILPNTYEFYWATSAENFRDRMVREHQNFWTEERIAKAKALNLNPVEVATLASIVEKETAQRDEMPIIAGLYLNRLRKGIKLQSDPTVIFGIGEALGRDTVVRRVLYQHLAFPSPYNTYLNFGLPPAPITIPDGRTLDAVLNAAQHNYIFMCANPDKPGYHSFAVNDQQHALNKKKYTNWLSQQGIYR